MGGGVVTDGGAFILDPARVRDLSDEVLDERGRMRVLPASYWAGTTTQERGLFGYTHGIYGFPTTELVEYLQGVIAGRSAIEIGAGNGVLAEALGIPATDSRQQEVPKYREAILAAGQPLVRYGDNVIELDARRAVRRYGPDVVVACWVTHKYDRHRHRAGGNEAGVDEGAILDSCQYVLIGNEQVHRDKRIWDRPHHIEYPPFVFSRAMNGTRDFVATWRKDHRQGSV
jgi:hypothetical protein